MIEEAAAHEIEDERIRRLICEHLEQTQFIEAGAGTGKTRALVDRFVAQVLSGMRVEQIVAITFTERAAAELSDRVRADLEQRLPASEIERDLLARAIEDLDRAHISTIHSFAASVLRSFAAEYGIDPSFKVQDELAGDRRFDERWRTFLDDAGHDVLLRGAIHCALHLGLQTGDLRILAHELWSHGDLAELMQTAPLQAAPARFPDIASLIASLRDLDLDSVPENDRLRTNCEEVLEELIKLDGCAESERESLLAALAPNLKASTYGQSANWGGAKVIGSARGTMTGVCDELKIGLEALRSQALADLLIHFVRFTTDEMQTRLRDGDLLFDDLILQLRNLLRDRPDVRRRIRARYRVLMIDEFQDTDPLQVEIALLFGRDPDTEVLDSGRLFLVGDPKQSIYRFRRADMAVYASTAATVQQASGVLLPLSHNRRSRPAVIQFVNKVFAPFLGDGASPHVQPPYKTIHAYRAEDCQGPDVALIGQTLDISAKEVRWREAQQIAARCRSVVEDEWQIFDREVQESRLAGYRDVAILLPSRTILQALERALAAAGVPSRVESGSLVFATQEVRDLINCMTAIDDPTDDIAVVAALRSPAFACSDVELAEYRLSGGSFNYLWPDLDGRSGRVSASLRDLRAFHTLRHQRTIAALIERFIAERASIEAGMYVSGSRDSFRRARFVIERARAFETEEPATLRAFIEWMERRAGDAILDYEGAGLDDDEDAVRILTIHTSKGLEFPIVFLAGLGVVPSHRTTVLGYDRSTGEIGVAIGSKGRKSEFHLGPVENIDRSEREHEQAELARLLYVGTTRARDHLLISLYQRKGAAGCPAQRLIDVGVRNAAQQLDELPADQENPWRALDGLTVERYPAGEEAFTLERVRLVRATTQPPVTSATALAIIARDEDEAKNDLRTDDNEPWARGRAGTHRGRAVHAALQVVPWGADGETIAALARAQAVAESIPAEGPVVQRLLEQALSMSVAERARSARRALREVPFALVQDGVTIEGFIDLVLEQEAGLEIVDWKTDAVTQEAVPQRLHAYRLQAGLYVLAIEAVTHQPVRRVTYAFVHPRVEASPGEPAVLAAEALESVRKLATMA